MLLVQRFKALILSGVTLWEWADSSRLAFIKTPEDSVFLVAWPEPWTIIWYFDSHNLTENNFLWFLHNLLLVLFVIPASISELDGMDVDLALVTDSACQDLGVHSNFTWIPVQALEQVIKCRMTYIFIIRQQEWNCWPVQVFLLQLPPEWKNNLNTQKINDFLWVLLVFPYLCPL